MRRSAHLAALAPLVVLAVAAACGGGGTEPRPVATRIEKVNDLPNALVAGAGDSIRVRVLDQNGNPLGGVAVTFTVTGGGGSITQTTVTTGAGGIAATRWVTGTTVALNTASASAAGVAGSVTFSATTVAGPPVEVVVVGPRTIVLDSGATFTPTWQSRDANGNPTPPSSLTFFSRGPQAAVSPTGTITAVLPGQAMVVGRGFPLGMDSVLVIVARPTAPLVRTDLSDFSLTAGALVSIGIFVDMRRAVERLGSTAIRVQWPTDVLTYQNDVDGAAGAGATVNTAAAGSGILRLAVASSDGWTGPVEIRRITFRVASTLNRAGTITFAVTELTAATSFADLLPVTVVASHPVRTQ